MSDDFAKLWSDELLRDLLAKRRTAQRSLDALKNTDSHYAEAHRLMLRLYDAAISAVRAEMTR